MSYIQNIGVAITDLTAKMRKLAAVIYVPVWRHALWHYRVAAGAEHVRVLRNIGSLRTVVDIGANRGQFALAARYSFPDSKIISFEPLPEPAALYKRVFENDSSSILHEAAIGPVIEDCSMHVSARDDSSSLLPIAELQSEIFPGTGEVGVVNVHVAPLSEFIDKGEIVGKALLKLDVQGFEMEALHGCETLLAEFDWIYCECSFVELYSGQKLAADVIEWLATNGFRINGMYNPSYDREGKSIQADFLFYRMH